MSGESARPALPAARFLCSVASDHFTGYWFCDICLSGGKAEHSQEIAPRAHTAETGHSTVIRLVHQVEIEGVRY